MGLGYSWGCRHPGALAVVWMEDGAVRPRAISFVRGPSLAARPPLLGGIFPRLWGGPCGLRTPPAPPNPSGLPQLYLVGTAPSDVPAKLWRGEKRLGFKNRKQTKGN